MYYEDLSNDNESLLQPQKQMSLLSEIIGVSFSGEWSDKTMQRNPLRTGGRSSRVSVYSMSTYSDTRTEKGGMLSQEVSVGIS